MSDSKLKATLAKIKALPPLLRNIVLGSIAVWLVFGGLALWAIQKATKLRTEAMQAQAKLHEATQSDAMQKAIEDATSESLPGGNLFSQVPSSVKAESKSENTNPEKAPLVTDDNSKGKGEEQKEVTEKTAKNNEAQLSVSVNSEVNTQDTEAWRTLVIEYAGRGELDKALPYLDRALAGNDATPEFIALAARVAMGGGLYEKARTLALMGLVKQPHAIELKVLALMANFRMGHTEDALKDAMEALQSNPKDIDLLTALGTIQAEMHPDETTADWYLGQALKFKPTHLPALYQLGRRQLRAGNALQAEGTFRKILGLRPDHPKALGQLGIALYNQEKLEAARQSFISALSLQPRDYNTWYNLGEVYLAQTALNHKLAPEAAEAIRRRAFTCFTKALDLKPDHSRAHFRLGVLLIGNNQPKEAVRHLEQALVNEPAYIPTLLQLAVAYEALKQFEKAREVLAKAFEIDPLNKAVVLKLREMG